MLTKIAVDDVVVGTRLRKVDDIKVKELAQSIEDVGLINPISIDEKNNLIAGNHRISAFRLLGRTEIPAMVFTADEEKEIDGNRREPLCKYFGSYHKVRVSKNEKLSFNL